MSKFLIIGHARHGKDTVADMLKDILGLTFESSSVAASRIFLFDVLKEQYGYKTPEECFEDRVNHRQQWHDLICEFNREDKAKLAKEILTTSDIYVGMRDDKEIIECNKQRLFDKVIGVFDPRKPLEDIKSFDVDLWKRSNVIIPNAGSLDELEYNVRAALVPMLSKSNFLNV